MKISKLKVSDGSAILLMDYLKKHPVLCNNQIDISYNSTDLISVPVKPNKISKPLNCWFNVKAQETTTTIPIFGWALWEGIYPDTVMAQHHAILLDKNTEQYICTTPQHADEVKDITFFADNRVPFDYHSMTRYPSLLFSTSHEKNKSGQAALWLNENLEPLTLYVGEFDNFAML